MARVKLETTIALRVSDQLKKDFIEKVTRSGRRPTDVLRQFIEAYIAGAPVSTVIPQQNEGVS